MINVLRRRDPEQRRLRRGMYLLPSLFTMANVFCASVPQASTHL